MKMSFLVLPVMVVMVATATGEKPKKTDWVAVQSLRSGTLIHVRTRKAKVVCTLTAVDADNLTCEHGAPLAFRRAEIRSVSVPRPNPHHASSVLVGGAAFAAVGAVVGVAETASNNYWEPKQKQQSLGWGALEGAGVFVGVAAIVDFWPRADTIYTAP